MMPIIIFLLTCLFPLSVGAVSTDEIDQFLSSRQVISQVFFSKQTTELSIEAKKQIDTVVSDLQSYKKQQMLIRVEGFASTEGEDQYNFKLSLLRALAVGDYLIHKHNLSVSVFLTSFGEKKKSAGKLAMMRRVDIAVYKKNRAAEALFDQAGTVERFILR